MRFEYERRTKSHAPEENQAEIVPHMNTSPCAFVFLFPNGIFPEKISTERITAKIPTPSKIFFNITTQYIVTSY